MNQEISKFCVTCGKRMRYNSYWRLVHNKCVKEFDDADIDEEYIYNHETGILLNNEEVF